VANAVYNQTNITLCVLDNATTAMTGAQPHPGTGIRMSFDAAAKDAENALRIPAVLRALGVGHVAEVDPFDFDAAVEAVRAAVDFTGPSALVFKAPCITVAPRSAQRSAHHGAQHNAQPVIDIEACTNCRGCIRAIGCPALVVRDGQVAIDKTLCFGCGLCVHTCCFDAIRVARAGEGHA
jgi:indolepyruvate ferredoxin oxidoreductase alpha subunit